MITELQPRVIVLHLTDALFAQLQPFLSGLDITATTYAQGASQEVVAHGESSPFLTMRVEIYDALAERVGSALDFDVRWQPNEYEPDGFVERVHPLQLINRTSAPANCPLCGPLVLANRTAVVCACGQAIPIL